MRLDVIVRHYIWVHRKRKRSELDWFANQPCLETAVEKAALAEDQNRHRLLHQRRIERQAMESVRTTLMKMLAELASSRRFDDLHDLLCRITDGIDGIGELYIYDLALHLGAKLGLTPGRVYLHGGTREGAKHLQLPYQNAWLGMNELPHELHRLSAYEIEDALCIYKDRF